MVNEKLEHRDVYGHQGKSINFDKDAGKLLNGCIAHLVQAMKSIELDGVETRERIEEYVINRMGVYERMYYAIDPTEFNVLLDLEISNSHSRASMKGGSND